MNEQIVQCKNCDFNLHQAINWLDTFDGKTLHSAGVSVCEHDMFADCNQIHDSDALRFCEHFIAKVNHKLIRPKDCLHTSFNTIGECKQCGISLVQLGRES